MTNSPLPSPRSDPAPPALTRLQASVSGGVLLGALLGLVDAVMVWRFDPASPAARSTRAFAELLSPGPMWRVTPIFLTAPLVNMALLGAAGAVLGTLRSRSAAPRAPLRSEVARDALTILFALVCLFVLALGAALARSSRTPALVLLATLAGAAVLYGVHRLLVVLVSRLLASRPASFVLERTPWRKVLALVGGVALALATIPPAFAPRGELPKLAALGAPGTPSRPPPNLVLVVIDTARADRFSSYGYGLPTTPEMDRLAAGGLLFERAIAPGAWTVPSHASLLTGAPLCVHGADATRPFLGAGLATLPEILARHGYRTGGFSNNPLFSSITGMTRGFERFEDHWRAEGPAPLSIYQRPAELVLAKWKRGKVHGGADVTLPRVLAWIDEVRATSGGEAAAGEEPRPFFAFVNLMEPHVRLTYHPGVTDRFRDPADSVDDLLRTPQTAFQLVHEHEELRREDTRRYGALYDGELAFADAAIGEFTRELDRRGLGADTLIVITSDHGEAIGEHDTFSHGQTVHDEVMRVPLIVRQPGRVPAGMRVRTPVSTAEIVPTLLAAAGVPAPRADGAEGGPRDLLGEVLEPRPVVAEVESMEKMIGVVRKVDADAASTASRKSGHKALYDGALKYIARGDGERQLFDLDADPAELTNLASARPGDVERLEGALAAWRRGAGCEGGDARTAAGAAALTLDPDAERALRSLGYVD